MNILNILQGKMSHKKTWNVSNEQGENISHKYIIEILKESPDNSKTLPELIQLLNSKTKHMKFTQNTKKKPISVYLRSTHGSVLNFLDNFSFYGIAHKDDNIYVTLFDHQLTYNDLEPTIKNEYQEWVLVDSDAEDYIL